MQQAPYVYQQTPDRPTSGLAIASLILSILGLVQILPFIGTVLGLIFGYMAKGSIAESRGAVGGDGLAKAGIIISWVTIGIYVIGVCLALAFFVVLPAVGLGGMSICAELEGMQ